VGGADLGDGDGRSQAGRHGEIGEGGLVEHIHAAVGTVGDEEAPRARVVGLISAAARPPATVEPVFSSVSENAPAPAEVAALVRVSASWSSESSAPPPQAVTVKAAAAISEARSNGTRGVWRMGGYSMRLFERTTMKCCRDSALTAGAGTANAGLLRKRCWRSSDGQAAIGRRAASSSR
jgi:hypothetical protein